LDKATSNEAHKTRKPTLSMNSATARGKEKVAAVDECSVQHETNKATSKGKENVAEVDEGCVQHDTTKATAKGKEKVTEVGERFVDAEINEKRRYVRKRNPSIQQEADDADDSLETDDENDPDFVDANNMTWVIAYAQVEMETKDSWIWFLQLLMKDIKLANQYEFTFISDKQKFLVEAFEEVVPNCDHRFCARHLSTNFSLVYKGKILKDAMWRAAFATTVPKFRRAMEVLRTLDGEAYTWLTSNVLRAFATTIIFL
ncbi:PREDICTED: transposon Mutator sub-class, partial [Prunus dulcis]